MAVLWGIPYLLIRVAVRQLDPGRLGARAYRPGVAAARCPSSPTSGRGRLLVKNLKWIVVFGVVEFGVPWYLMSTSERHITSSLTSLIICAVPLFSVVAGRFTSTHEPIGTRRLRGARRGRRWVSRSWSDSTSRVARSPGSRLMLHRLRGLRHRSASSWRPNFATSPVRPSSAAPRASSRWAGSPTTSYHWPTRVSSRDLDVGGGSVDLLHRGCVPRLLRTHQGGGVQSLGRRGLLQHRASPSCWVSIGLHEPFTIGIASGLPVDRRWVRT